MAFDFGFYRANTCRIFPLLANPFFHSHKVWFPFVYNNIISENALILLYIGDNPFEVLLRFKSISPRAKGQTGKRAAFPFVGRGETLEYLLKDVILPSWEDFNSASPKQKERWAAAYIYGGAGVGKTRLSQELLLALSNHLSLLRSTITDANLVSHLLVFLCIF